MLQASYSFSVFTYHIARRLNGAANRPKDVSLKSNFFLPKYEI